MTQTLLLLPDASTATHHNGACSGAPGVRCQTPIVRYGEGASTLCSPCQARLGAWKAEQRELRRALQRSAQ
jgi:hypothetical protein